MRTIACALLKVQRFWKNYTEGSMQPHSMQIGDDLIHRSAGRTTEDNPVLHIHLLSRLQEIQLILNKR